MMKRFIVSLMILLPLFAGCKKASYSEPLPPAGVKMTFKADFSAVKSHFNDPSSPQLYWDDTDHIAVYALPLWDALMQAPHYQRNQSELLSISEISADGISATFSSLLDKESWFLAPQVPLGEEYDDIYQFFAYYPASAAGDVSEVEMDGDTYQYIPFTIPSEQDGVSYPDYQVLYDPGLPENENDDMDPYIVSKSSVMADESQVVFSHLNPVTAMIRYTLRLPDGSTPIQIENLEIKTLGDADANSIAGDARLMLYYYGNDNVPYCFDRPSHVEYLLPASSGNTAINIRRSLQVTDQASSYFYAVLLPVRTKNTGIEVKFTATDEDGNYYVSRIPIPELYEYDHDTYYGFQGGCRYKTAVTLYPVEMNPDAGSAGQYTDGGDPFEEI